MKKGMESASVGIFRQTLNTIETNKQNAARPMTQQSEGVAQKKRMLTSPQVQWYGADGTPGDGEDATAF